MTGQNERPHTHSLEKGRVRGALGSWQRRKIQLGSVHRGCVSVEVAGKLLISITKEQRSLWDT